MFKAYYQKHETPEVWCKPGLYTTKFENTKKFKNDSGKFLKGNPHMDVTVNWGEKWNIQVINMIATI